MTLTVENDRIKLIVDGSTQFWKVKEGVSTTEVFDLLKKYAEKDGGVPARVMSALKKLATVVNEELSPDQAKDKALTQENVDKGNPDLPQNQEGAQVNESTEQTQQVDPNANVSQVQTGGEAPKSDSLEHPDNPSPTTDILGHDAEISLNEYCSRPTFQLNEADLNVSWRKTVQGLEVRINGQLYVYDPLDPDLTVDKVFEKVEKIGAHSKGKALGWLEAQRRAGNIRSYKVKDDEHSPKGWERKIQPALEKKGATQISILPSTDDWQAEFSLNEIQGFINANLYSGEWSLDWSDTKEKGIGLDTVVKTINDLKVPKKESLTEDKNTPWQVLLKDKETGKEMLHAQFANETDANEELKIVKKWAAEKKLDAYVKKVNF